MRKVLMLAMFSVLFFSAITVSIAQSNKVVINLFQMKYLGYDSSNNGYRLSVNISLNQPGHLTYLEEYYVVNNNYPRFVNSYKYDFGDLVEENSNYTASFEILRPTDYYTLIKGIILLDNKRIAEGWLTKNTDFIDNTGWGDDENTQINNVDKYEIRENTINVNRPVIYEYTIPGPIYEINVTGKANADTNLRLELLKDVPSNAYAPPTGIVYKYVNIIADNNEIKEIAPKYKVEISWLEDNKIKRLGMIGWDKDNKSWLPLSTKRIDKDNKYIYFESTSPDLSTYAIIGFVPIPSNTTQNISIKSTTDPPKMTPSAAATDTKLQSKKEEPLVKNIPGFESDLATESVLAIAILLLIRRRK